jgi:hypothetical protein
LTAQVGSGDGLWLTRCVASAVDAACERDAMVRRGSTVRVRQRASRMACKTEPFALVRCQCRHARDR